jgi:hypothetical protein
MAVSEEMTFTESMAEAAALGWFKELGLRCSPVLQLAPGEPAAELDLFSDLVLVDRLSEAIRQINPASSKAPQATVAQPATVQSICGRNL